MRAGLIGLISGIVLTLLALFVLQRIWIRQVAEGLSYRFPTCVFYQGEFPQGDLVNGRMLRRCLFPFKVTTTFYDAGYHEVQRADHLGRYGAVVRIQMAGMTVYRFVTLYRMAAQIYWGETPLPITAQLPPQLGIDPAVVRAQQQEIGTAIENGLIDDDGNMPEGMAVLLAGLSETPSNAPPMLGRTGVVSRTGVVARDANWWFGLRQQIGLAQKYPYLVDLPKDYGTDAGKRWPLILVLGNADDRGHDRGLVRVSGLTGLIAKGKQLPAVVISPQCPSNEGWNWRVLSQLLDEVCVKYPIDRDRIYLTRSEE